ncbi:6-phospho-beta-glucosidase [Erysipelothrix inopinata]|uniref:6-phospho-beta-glucosidase n=1 Tax=Erysipelothrix inopinata TaxID=225084 RepID=A0A7G9RZ60_9FIRM|nr:6-phospho-beta-glucosidase [Erysipelothrix inopinata]QNN60885.1 6-phospho-beta-glucosidase [Erysipelothrix inopinata]
MNKRLKIVTIGGGSSYTPELMEGFINRADRLDIKELWLVDVEEGREKLEIVGAMAQRMIEASGLDTKVFLTLDRREALKDADFVTTQFRVGQLSARVKDERIPGKYGLLGQETNGAGGIFKAFRTIPVILDIIKDMEELCPNAWLIDFTNPAGMVTEAAIKVGGWKRTIGLCNIPVGATKANHEAMGYDENDQILFEKFAGLNHFHWHRVWDRDGSEVTDQLIEAFYNPESEYAKSKKAEVANIAAINYTYEQVKDLGMLPCPYHRYYYIEREMLDENLQNFKDHKTRAETVKATEAELFELYKDPELNYKPEQLTKRGGAHYSDAACEIIASIHNDSRTVMTVSTQNNGTVVDLPYDCIVEVTSVITSHGAEPFNWGTFPPAARGQLQLMKAMEETVIEAAVTGDYGKAVQAFTINPLIQSGNYTIDLLNEMLVAHKDHLPQFKETIEKLEAQGVKYIAD